ncbi:MAG TPA: hypothetical protein VIK75_10390 [Calditerricola sp.]
MRADDRAMVALLALVVVMLVGMLTGSWRAVLYPYLVVIGLCLAVGLVEAIRRWRRLIILPVAVTVLYLGLFVLLDVLTGKEPTGGSGTVFGLVSSTALYLLGIWPLALVLALLYAWTFDHASQAAGVSGKGKGKDD